MALIDDELDLTLTDCDAAFAQSMTIEVVTARGAIDFAAGTRAETTQSASVLVRRQPLDGVNTIGLNGSAAPRERAVFEVTKALLDAVALTPKKGDRIQADDGDDKWTIVTPGLTADRKSYRLECVRAA